jgi:ELWxxDGT repeat protein
MKSKHLLFTAALFFLFARSNAQTPEFVMDNVNYLAVSNGKLFLEIADYSTKYKGVWISNGTAIGSSPLKELSTPRYNSYVECNGLSYFLSEDAKYYAELWATDGTATGTTLVKNLKPAALNEVTILSAFNNKLYFIGNDAEHGKELWASDGTESGTKLLKDINPGVENSMDFSSAIVYKNKMFFKAKNGQSNEELWVSDGTIAGTKLFKDINPNGSSSPRGFSVVKDKMFFSATTEAEGTELWVSDGTEAGTHLVKDITPKSEYDSPGIPFEYNGKAYFLIQGNNKGSQLWTTDGTELGTTFVEDSLGFSTTVFNGELYYGKIISKNVISFNYALYKTNGKPGDGSLVKVISGGKSTDSPRNFVQANGKLYFLCNYDNSGANYLNNDLWETDGTTANTKLIAYSPGKLVDVNRLTGLTAYNNALYFTDLGKKLYRIGTPNTAVANVAFDYSGLILFPNPASNQLTIKTDSRLIDSNYTVLNIMGQTVHSGKITGDNTLLNVGDLPGGTYFVRVQSKGGGSISRFIKKLSN